MAQIENEHGFEIQYEPNQIIKIMDEEGATLYDVLYAMGLENFEDEIRQDMVEHGFIQTQ